MLSNPVEVSLLSDFGRMYLNRPGRKDVRGLAFFGQFVIFVTKEVPHVILCEFFRSKCQIFFRSILPIFFWADVHFTDQNRRHLKIENRNNSRTVTAMATKIRQY